MLAGTGVVELNKGRVYFGGNRKFSVVGHWSARQYRICETGFIRYARTYQRSSQPEGKSKGLPLGWEACIIEEEEMVDSRAKGMCV